jgi:hypothetical protein
MNGLARNGLARMVDRPFAFSREARKGLQKPGTGLSYLKKYSLLSSSSADFTGFSQHSPLTPSFHRVT